MIFVDVYRAFRRQQMKRSQLQIIQRFQQASSNGDKPRQTVRFVPVASDIFPTTASPPRHSPPPFLAVDHRLDSPNAAPAAAPTAAY